MRIHILLLSIIFTLFTSNALTFEYSWQIDATPEGQETVTPINPIEVEIIGDQIHMLPTTPVTQLLVKKYSVFPDTTWDNTHTAQLLKTFESIPQSVNSLYIDASLENISIWMLTDQHIRNDIEMEHRDGVQFVTISKHAFVHANPFIAEIEGVRGRYFSKRLHRAVVRFVTDNGNNMYAIRRILRDRYSVNIDIPDYTELTKWTTGEPASRYSQFKPEELIALLTMLEEYPSGMLKTPGLKYLVRRLDGTLHPIYPNAPAIAWTGAGYIEFMETAFKDQGLDYIHRLILHEKAHFLWDYLFDEQLKQEWITLGGWYKNPDDEDGWSTTKQLEFVSAYAHAKNPNEDMAESISFYIVRPNKLRSRSPDKYQFIQDRIMHGTRYISQIREDLTFEVYNLYPDYVYPGKIVKVHINVVGESKEDKYVTISLELHNESELDNAHSAYTRIFSDKGSFIDVGFKPINEVGHRIISSHLLRAGPFKISKYAAHGFWLMDQISVHDANRNSRHEAVSDIGWQMYIDNPLADCEPPEYIPNSIKLSLRPSTLHETAKEGGEHQILNVSWLVTEQNDLRHVGANVNDDVEVTHSKGLFNYGYKFARREDGLIPVNADLEVPGYHASGQYSIVYLFMRDIAGNAGNVYFSNYNGWVGDLDAHIDESSPVINIQTNNPDITPPVIDLQHITIDAQPTRPEDPNGETNVYITFRVKDNISGYSQTVLYLRDPHGVMHQFTHWISNRDYHRLYFDGDPTIYQTYNKTILLPVGSVPGTWGLAQMDVWDKARNMYKADFTEIVRFEIVDTPTQTNKIDVNGDGKVNIQDLVLVANSINSDDTTADVNSDGVVNILDLVLIASEI